MRLGKQMGLSPFSVNLVIAIVQDQARRGYRPDDCPRAAEPDLRMVPLVTTLSHSSSARAWRVAWLISSLILLELLIANWLLA